VADEPVRSPIDVELAVTHATVVATSPAGSVVDGLLLVRGGVFDYVGPADQAPAYRARQTIDARGKLVYPGLVNTHTHLYQSLLRGWSGPRRLDAWLDAVVFPALNRLTPQTYEIATMLAGAQALRCGTTTIVDYTADHEPDLYRAALAGARRVGVRLRLARGLSGRGRPGMTRRPSLAESLDEVRALRSESAEPVGLALPPVPAMSDDALDTVSAFVADEGVPVTAHVAETPDDDHRCRAQHGRSVVARLADHGLLGPGFLAVHAVHLDDRDLARLAEAGAGISYNPVSNMYLNCGLAPIGMMRKLGITVGLGTDGAASNGKHDMIEAMKSAALAPGAPDDAAPAAAWALALATRDGAAALGAADRGTIAEGYRADFFVFDPARELATAGPGEPESMLVYSGSPSGVECVVVGGTPVVRDGRCTLVDEAQLGRAAQDEAARLAAVGASC
jgi:5-methylthioadenosine/S-adenosylhomocysteine deaminase